MRIPILHDQANEFHHRNLLLQLTLGLVSLGDRLEEILDADAPLNVSAEPIAESPGEGALIDFVLGVVAVHSSLRAHLEAACPGAAAQEPMEPRPEPRRDRSLRELMR